MVVTPFTLVLSTVGWCVGMGVVGAVFAYAVSGEAAIWSIAIPTALAGLIVGVMMNALRFRRWREGEDVQ